MARNKKEANKAVFRKLWNEVPAEFRHLVKEPQAGRWLDTSGEQQEWLVGCNVSAHFACVLGGDVAVLEHQGKTVVLAPMHDESRPSVRFVESQPNDLSGYLTVLWSLEDVSPNPHLEDLGARVVDEIFVNKGAYHISDLSPFFTPTTAYELSPGVPADLMQGYRVHTAQLLGSSVLPLQMNTDTQANILSLLEDDAAGYFAENLYRGVISPNWRHAFLEAYRCLESFFSAPYVVAVQHTLGSTKSLAEVGQSLHDTLGWRPREEEALKRLLNEVNSGLHARILAAVGESSADAGVAAVAKAVYRTRNWIAHFRPADPSHVEPNWEELFDSTILSVRELMAKYPSS